MNISYTKVTHEEANSGTLLLNEDIDDIIYMDVNKYPISNELLELLRINESYKYGNY